MLLALLCTVDSGNFWIAPDGFNAPWGVVSEVEGINDELIIATTISSSISSQSHHKFEVLWPPHARRLSRAAAAKRRLAPVVPCVGAFVAAARNARFTDPRRVAVAIVGPTITCSRAEKVVVLRVDDDPTILRGVDAVAPAPGGLVVIGKDDRGRKSVRPPHVLGVVMRPAAPFSAVALLPNILRVLTAIECVHYDACDAGVARGASVGKASVQSVKNCLQFGRWWAGRRHRGRSIGRQIR